MEPRPKQTEAHSTPGQTPLNGVDPSLTGHDPGGELDGQEESLRSRIAAKLGDVALLATVESIYRYDVIKRNVGHLAKQTGNFIATASKWTREKTTDFTDEGRLALNGMRLAIHDKRLQKAHQKRQDLAVRAEVLQAAPRRILEDHRGLKPLPNPVSSNGSRSSSFYTISRRELSQAKRQEKRLRRNMIPASMNHNYALAYGHSIGSPEHSEKLAQTRLSKNDRREAERAGKQYTENHHYIEKQLDRVRNSADGLDIPGARVKHKIKRQDAKIAKLKNHHAKLTGRTYSLQERWLDRHPD